MQVVPPLHEGKNVNVKVINRTHVVMVKDLSAAMQGEELSRLQSGEMLRLNTLGGAGTVSSRGAENVPQV